MVTEIAPYLIPQTRSFYGAFNLTKNLGSALPSFYKSIEGIILGDDSSGNETELWKAATKAEGFMAKYNSSSYSDAGTKSMWNYEQIGDMILVPFLKFMSNEQLQVYLNYFIR